MTGKLGRKAAKQLEDEVKQLRSDMDGLLDILNAVLEANGGVIAISTAQLHNAKRRQVEVIHGPKGVLIKRESVKGVDDVVNEQPSTLSKLWLPGKGI